ncbi:hypothetical protein B0H17DRAFT_1152893 [Mycena rosella]|uniref:Uncharacterized protein n=1 Tax=Mycena rosella TaxID=1033263 RepID=A0AAD7FEA5_MYCRO|nr:hypothetical protein B0H17DRAFT_1152893 [Mycena rosella]
MFGWYSGSAGPARNTECAGQRGRTHAKFRGITEHSGRIVSMLDWSKTARCGTCASGDARWIDRDEGICGGQEREPWQRREGTDLRFNAEVRENEGNRRENARKDWSSPGEPNTDEQVRESREMARIGAKVDSRGTVRECGPVGPRLRISERSAGGAESALAEGRLDAERRRGSGVVRRTRATLEYTASCKRERDSERFKAGRNDLKGTQGCS